MHTKGAMDEGMWLGTNLTTLSGFLALAHGTADRGYGNLVVAVNDQHLCCCHCVEDST